MEQLTFLFISFIFFPYSMITSNIFVYYISITIKLSAICICFFTNYINDIENHYMNHFTL